MLMDESRNRTYERAIEEVVQHTPSPLFIIDLGAGTGLLSIMAHKAMTKYKKTGHIYAIEGSTKYADIARCNFEANGIDACTLITKNSKKVTKRDVDYHSCNILITETLGTFCHYEKMQVFVRDLIDRNILDTNAQRIPQTHTMTVRQYNIRHMPFQTETAVRSVLRTHLQSLSPPNHEVFVSEHDIGFPCSHETLVGVGKPVVLFSKSTCDDFKPFTKIASFEGDVVAPSLVVTEWTSQLTDNIMLCNTIESISDASNAQFTNRRHGWGFMLLPVYENTTFEFKITSDWVFVKNLKGNENNTSKKRKTSGKNSTEG